MGLIDAVANWFRFHPPGPTYHANANGKPDLAPPKTEKIGSYAMTRIDSRDDLADALGGVTVEQVQRATGLGMAEAAQVLSKLALPGLRRKPPEHVFTSDEIAKMTPAEFRLNSDVILRQQQARVAPDDIVTSRNDKTLAYLLGTWMEWDVTCLQYRMRDTQAERFAKLFPEEWDHFQRGLGDARKLDPWHNPDPLGAGPLVVCVNPGHEAVVYKPDGSVDRTYRNTGNVPHNFDLQHGYTFTLRKAP